MRPEPSHSLLEAGNRLAQSVTALSTDHVNRWVRVNLHDGQVHPTLYDSRADAAGVQYTFPVQIRREGMSTREAMALLRFTRQLADQGWEYTSPTHECRQRGLGVRSDVLRTDSGLILPN
jgi:hypothetical protein